MDVKLAVKFLLNNLRISATSSGEYLQFSGMLNLPLCIARALSPNGSVKKHSLYSRQPRA